MMAKGLSVIVLALTFGAFSATASSLKPEEFSAKKDPSAARGLKALSHDQYELMMMANEAHHVLAMAYNQNLATFAKTLHERTEHASSVNVEFVRAAGIEMRRSFDEMKLHHEAHVKTMSAEMHRKTSGMRKQMETQHTELIFLLDALAKEANLAAPDAKTVSALAANINTLCVALSTMNQGNKAETASN